MKSYDHKKIERKWRKYWQNKKIYRARDSGQKSEIKDNKCYVLDMFPYPSGEGLHVGHPKGYIATDVYSRYKKMQGFNVLHPMGWDAFGLPAENYAIKNKIHPSKAVKKNIKRYKDQLEILGFNYDWDREINTTDPKYYKWTQWMFLQMFKKGLAYESHEPINWCPSCQTGLANEDLEDGRCERCGSVVGKKPMRQWVLKITDYADRLLKNLDELDWPEFIKESQRNWIGKSDGAEIDFYVKNNYNYVLLHGFNGTPNNNFFPWLKEKLEKIGAKVAAPQLPNTNNPSEDGQVDYVLKNISFDENTILYAHSLGTVVAMKVLERLNKKIAGLVMSGGFIIPKFKDHSRNFEERFNWNFDFEKIKINTGFIKILSDINDRAVPIEQGRLLRKKLMAELKEVIAEKPHFDAKVEPAILEAVIPKIKVFTTRPDTIFGATYLVLAPEHNFVNQLLATENRQIKNKEEILRYIARIKNKTEVERTAENKEKTGVELKGIKAVNPASGEEIPVWIADYVLPQYGTGAIMAVPSCDERDFQFAGKFGLPMREIIKDNVLINSGQFSGSSIKEAEEKIIKFVGGKKKTTYKLRDWVFSRQRYWGEPIPLIHCGKCGVVAVPEKDLPVELPKVKNYEPTGTGESPLANIKSWVNVKCPECKSPGKRETNTMPQWAGSCWYYLRFMDPKNSKRFVELKKEKYWSPVDVYSGGDHAVRHLIYARFWHKFLYDIGVVNVLEPFKRLKYLGFILAPDGKKMSKRYGNVINPDDIVKTWGADTLRVYEMFMGPFEQTISWSTDNMIGSRRFLEKIWRLVKRAANGQRSTVNNKLKILLNDTVKKVGEDIENFRFNTAISSLMILANRLEKEEKITREDYETTLKLLTPFAPHITEELWHNLGNKSSIYLSNWPKYKNLKAERKVTIAIQINGKVRETLEIRENEAEDLITKEALTKSNIVKRLRDQEIKKIIYVKNKIINIVTS